MTGFKDLQYAFAELIRNPDKQSDLAIDKTRLNIYQSLIFNTVSGFINTAFPVLKSLYSEQDWHRLQTLFLRQHKSQQPLFCQIAQEFIEFLANEYQVAAQDPIFLKELAHYEWLELDLSLRSRNQTAQQIEDVTQDNFYFSDLAELVSYPFAVHQISLDNQPVEPNKVPTYLVLYRNHNEQVDFVVINTLSAYLLELIKNNLANNYQSLYQLMVKELTEINATQLEQGLILSLQQFAERSILLKNKFGI
ncbi:putative DNA-binding domain-containing protein [Catenovulum sp. 2E275]|uniref:HvfC family RiPP maturation protein n=1 Tax=Catenovulum sp. 2E275 TaxID=2980497 RepID=UPI0021D14621|nr:putative DNA-binding domain-containing protein [Catenovulum sp. 2E275]MCU4674982.1 putative DNA-binding domain-containing protein [Catenovulum sp. 2E275]